MKPLKPSMREKKRYLKLKGKIDDVEKAVLDFSGILGLSKTGLKFIKKNKNTAVISVNRETLDLVRASFVVWPNEIKIEKVSGTLKGLKGLRKSNPKTF